MRRIQVSDYTFKGFRIRPDMLDILQRYIDHGIQPGSFLTAVICNDLRSAVSYADDENIANIPAYIGYLSNEAPIGCWGSYEAMNRHIAIKMQSCGSYD
jgi:hypothetical protein